MTRTRQSQSRRGCECLREEDEKGSGTRRRRGRGERKPRGETEDEKNGETKEGTAENPTSRADRTRERNKSERDVAAGEDTSRRGPTRG